MRSNSNLLLIKRSNSFASEREIQGGREKERKKYRETGRERERERKKDSEREREVGRETDRLGKFQC